MPARSVFEAGFVNVRVESARASSAAMVAIWAVVGAAAALVAALVFPLGGSEAVGLAWLANATAPGIGWGEPFRHVLARAWAQELPVAALAVAAIGYKLVPALGALLALRLPDVLAAGVVTGCMARLNGAAAGALACLVFVVSPALWAMAVGPPGLLLDAGALILLYAALCGYRAGTSRARLGLALAAIAVVVANGDGVYAIAVVGGVYVHNGLVCGEWRLLGNLRLTVLAVLVLAGLTLIDVIGLPRIGRVDALYQYLLAAVQYNGLALPRWLFAALLVGPTLAAIGQMALEARGAATRLALVIASGVSVLACARGTPSFGALALAPFLALWWVRPVDDHRFTAPVLASVYVGCALAAALALLCIGRAVPLAESMPRWIAVALAAVLAVAALACLWPAWRGFRPAAAAAVALALASVIAMASLWLLPPQGLMIQRAANQQFRDDLAARDNGPMAVLAPVDAALWRAQLDRPVYVVRDMPGLCRWAAAHGGRRHATVLVRPGATDPVLGRFAGARAVQQSPGTMRTSVMAIDLGPDGRCRGKR